MAQLLPTEESFMPEAYLGTFHEVGKGRGISKRIGRGGAARGIHVFSSS